ncbi:MAG: bifunctional oligoribonuclease/PAP phosphatase NrnA [Caldilineaceae bacterium]
MIGDAASESSPIDEALLASLRKSKNVLCVSHVAPDGDALGSLTGMGHIMRRLGAATTLALQDETPAELKFLPGAAKIIGPKQVTDTYDLIVCLDASSADRMGNIYRTEAHAHIPLIVIDHHITNTRFGQLNWVAPDCAATCQMLLYLADGLGLSLDEPLATCLLTGLVTDTLCFRTSNTDARVMEAAMRLMAAGANLSDITARALNRRSYNLFKLWGLVLPSVQLDEGVIWVSVLREQAKAAGMPKGDVQLSSILVTANEADISAVFVEKMAENGGPAVECSFRARPGFNVGEVAFQLGGGGHPPASGCTIPGTMDEVTPRVVELLKQARRKGLEANQPPA